MKSELKLQLRKNIVDNQILLEQIQEEIIIKYAYIEGKENLILAISDPEYDTNLKLASLFCHVDYLKIVISKDKETLDKQRQKYIKRVNRVYHK